MIRVESVAPDSIGADLGLERGTDLISINDRELRDFLDWEFLTADEQFTLLARLPNGQAVEFDIERGDDTPMGVEVEPPRIRRCGNRCDFCFVDGLPEGMRNTLYVRDDDYRLSFRHGNFATLTNLKPADIDRILEYRLSPLYVSVHATDPVVRRRVLRNPRAPAILSQLEMLAAGGIRFHTQIVLQPGVNDGAVLQRSLTQLYALGDAVLTVAVVPVGLTAFSMHERVREPTRDECRAALRTVAGFADRAMTERGQAWALGSDELYLRADLALPPAEVYGAFDQVENGVGSVRYLEMRVTEAGDTLPDLTGVRLGVVTGTAMGRLMPVILHRIEALTGASTDLIVVENNLFGPAVTTAGLLPGSAIAGAVTGRDDLELVLLPAEALDHRGRFVDDVPAAAVAQAAGHSRVRFSHHFSDVLRQEPGM